MKGGTQTQPNSQIKQSTDSQSKKPTAEQIRYAQLLGNEDPKLVQEKIRLVSDVTGRNIDEASVALHDCNYDTELAINSLIEGQHNQNEWVISSNRKKKHQGGVGTTQGIDSINTTGKPIKENTLKQSRGGSRGGRNRSSDKSWDSDQKDNDENRPSENGRGRGLREDRSSSDRRTPSGRGGPNRRGRGGGNRGRSSSRGRGGRVGKTVPPISQSSSNGPSVNGTEMWDSIDAEEELKEKTESWDDVTQPAETWDNDTYIHLPPVSVKEPVAPSSVSSLFSSVSHSNSWTTDCKDQPWGNGESVTTNGTSLQSTNMDQANDSTPFAPESVDMAIIHSKLQSPSRSSTDQPHTNNELSSLMHMSMSSSVNQNHLGPISKLLDNVSMQTLNQQAQSVSTAQPQRPPKTSRSKRSQKSQIPLQAVEMPESMMDDLDVQFGQLEFGGDFSGSPIKTKAVESTVSMPSEEERPPKQQTVESDVMFSSLSSSLSRSVPVTIASTTSAASSLTGLDDNSPRHFAHASPRDSTSQVLERSQTPTSSNESSSLSGVSRSPTMQSSSLQSTQLVSSLPKENTLDSRAYQVGQQHMPSQSVLPPKDQLTSNSLGHHTSLGVTAMSSVQRADNHQSNHPLQPPPGVGVPHTTSQQSTTATVSSSSRPAQHSGKPSLPPGVLPINTLYGMQQPGMLPGYSMPFYEELQRQMHMPQAYYDLSFTGQDNLPATFQGDQKFGRSDASSPVQTTVNQPQNQHHMQQQQQQAYLNAAATMPPYGFGGLAFYPGSGIMPGGFPAYSAPMYQQMPPKTHVNVSQYQQQPFNNQHGSHNYTSGYDDISGGHDFKSPYHSTVTQTQSKSSAVISTSSDISGGSTYKSQIGKYDTKPFLGGTPPPLSLGQHSHLGNYPGHTPPYMSIVPPTQQHHPHSLFHHHAVVHQHQDIGQGGLSQRGQQSQMSKQSQSKGSYASGFWSSGNKS